MPLTGASGHCRDAFEKCTLQQWIETMACIGAVQRAPMPGYGLSQQPAGLVQFIEKTNENNEMETHETKRKYDWKIDDDCSRNSNIFFEMFWRIENEKDLYRIAS